VPRCKAAHHICERCAPFYRATQFPSRRLMLPRFRQVLLVNRRTPGKQFVQEHAETVDVASCIDIERGHLRHVRRPENHAVRGRYYYLPQKDKVVLF